MPIGDGSVTRNAIAAFLDALHRIAAPTGARASIVLMTGGLTVLGFLFLAFLFRSAIVGDVAAPTIDRPRVPRLRLPPTTPTAPTARSPMGFDAARAHAARWETARLDETFVKLRAEGVDARILGSTAQTKRIRLYACASCAGGGPCERERGLLAGAFEAMTGELAKVDETTCRAQGAGHCEFEIRHAPLPEAPV